MEHLLIGVAIGFLMAVPVGPINLLCLRRSLAEGRRVGFVSGLGAAAADTTYGAIAAVGLATVTSFLLNHHLGLQLFAGLFLVGLGLHTVLTRTPPRSQAASVHVRRLWDAFVSTYVYTLANPLLIVVFTGVFARLGLGWQPGRTLNMLELIAGVFLGSSLWWLVLTMLAGTVGRRLDDGTLRRVNFIAGLIIIAIGVWQLFPLLESGFF
jgi:threonine/homoserine/homoserine lactone efflux protein